MTRKGGSLLYHLFKAGHGDERGFGYVAAEEEGNAAGWREDRSVGGWGEKIGGKSVNEMFRYRILFSFAGSGIPLFQQRRVHW